MKIVSIYNRIHIRPIAGTAIIESPFSIAMLVIGILMLMGVGSGLAQTETASLQADRVANLNLSTADLAVFPEDMAILGNPVWEAEMRSIGSAWIKPPNQDYEPFPLALESRPMRLPRVGVEIGLDWDGETVIFKTTNKPFIVTASSVPGLVTFIPPFSEVKLRSSAQSWMDMEAGDGNADDIKILFRTPNAQGAAFSGARLLGGIPQGSSGRFDLFRNKTFTFRALEGELWAENIDGARSNLIPEAPPVMGGPRITVKAGPFQTPRLVQLNPFQELSMEVISANENILDSIRGRTDRDSQPVSMSGQTPQSSGDSRNTGTISDNQTNIGSDGIGSQAASESFSESQTAQQSDGIGSQSARVETFEAGSGFSSDGIGSQVSTESTSESQSALQSDGIGSQAVAGQIRWERIEVTLGEDQKFDVVGGVTEVIEDPATGALVRLEMNQEEGSVSIRVEKGAFQVNIPQHPYFRPLLFSGQQIVVSFTVGSESIEIENPSSENIISGPLDGLIIDCTNQVYMRLQAGGELIYQPVDAPGKFLVSSNSAARIYNGELDRVFVLKFQVGFMQNGVLYAPGKELNSENSRAIGYQWQGDELIVITEFGNPITIGQGAMSNVSPDGLFEMQIRNNQRNSIEFGVESGKFELIPSDLVGWVFRIGTGNALQVNYNQSIGRLLVQTMPGHQGISQVKTPDGTLVNLESGGSISFKIQGGSVNLDFVAGGGVSFETPTGFPTSISGFPLDVPAGPDGRSMSAFNSSGFSTFLFETERVVQGPISGEEP